MEPRKLKESNRQMHPAYSQRVLSQCQGPCSIPHSHICTMTLCDMCFQIMLPSCRFRSSEKSRYKAIQPSRLTEERFLPVYAKSLPHFLRLKALEAWWGVVHQHSWPHQLNPHQAYRQIQRGAESYISRSSPHGCSERGLRASYSNDI